MQAAGKVGCGRGMASDCWASGNQGWAWEEDSWTVWSCFPKRNINMVSLEAQEWVALVRPAQAPKWVPCPWLGATRTLRNDGFLIGVGRMTVSIGPQGSRGWRSRWTSIRDLESRSFREQVSAQHVPNSPLSVFRKAVLLVYMCLFDMYCMIGCVLWVTSGAASVWHNKSDDET